MVNSAQTIAIGSNWRSDRNPFATTKKKTIFCTWLSTCTVGSREPGPRHFAKHLLCNFQEFKETDHKTGLSSSCFICITSTHTTCPRQLTSQCSSLGQVWVVSSWPSALEPPLFPSASSSATSTARPAPRAGPSPSPGSACREHQAWPPAALRLCQRRQR